MHCLVKITVVEGVDSIKLMGLKVKSSSNSHKGMEDAHSKSSSIVVSKDGVLLLVTMYKMTSFEFG
jgi:hypothetical protein